MKLKAALVLTSLFAATVTLALAETKPGQVEAVTIAGKNIGEVVECHRITGEDCFLLKLHLRAMEDLEGILDRFTPYGQTTTSIVHSSPVPPRPLPLGR